MWESGDDNFILLKLVVLLLTWESLYLLLLMCRLATFKHVRWTILLHFFEYNSLLLFTAFIGKHSIKKDRSKPKIYFVYFRLPNDLLLDFAILEQHVSHWIIISQFIENKSSKTLLTFLYHSWWVNEQVCVHVQLYSNLTSTARTNNKKASKFILLLDFKLYCCDFY